MIFKLTIFLCLLCLVLAQKYHTLDDDYDEDAAVQNMERLRSQFLCFLDKGPCSPVQQSYKDNIEEAIDRSCDKCIPKQEHEFKIFLIEGKKKLPNEYEQFKKKFDPQNKYFTKLEAELAKY